MNQRFIIFLLVIVLFTASACAPRQPEAETTPTPDPCTGWNCTLSGTTYVGSKDSGETAGDIRVQFRQVSNCSPSRGMQEGTTDADGSFTFDVFLHDTDSFVISIDEDNFLPFEKKFGGFDCLYCHCEPLDLVLEKR